MFLLGRDNTRVDLGLRVDTFGTIHAWANYCVRRVDDAWGPRIQGGGERVKCHHFHAWRVFLARRVDAAWKRNQNYPLTLLSLCSLLITPKTITAVALASALTTSIYSTILIRQIALIIKINVSYSNFCS